jgi:glycosyltransferase involved in cell wall biosynthesis
LRVTAPAEAQGGGAPLRVLQLVPSLRTGGAERVVADLARQLRWLGHTVAVASMFGPLATRLERDLEADGVPVLFLGKRPGLDLRMCLRIARTLRAFRPDVVHTHHYALRYALPAVATSARCRFVHTVHNLARFEIDRPSRLLQSVAYRRRVVPVAIGEAVARSFEEEYGRPPGQVIPNGIRVVEFSAPAGARERVRASLAIPPGAPTFVCVGRLQEQKNHAGLVRAFASERLRARGAYLLLAGDGELRAALERRVEAAGLRDRVRFLGVRSDVPSVLAAADAFVLASSWEGNPLSVMEAMAAGKPVVAAAVGCLPELVARGAGRLVPPGDEPALEAAMHELASDAALARRMGAAAARVAVERFDHAVMARAYERLYRETP